MREVRVSGGYNDPLITDVGNLGTDLEAVVAKGVLVPEGGTWPAQADASWQPLVVEDNGDTTAAVSWLITAAQPSGHFHWFVQLQVGALLLLLRVRDPEDPEQPWHIWVH